MAAQKAHPQIHRQTGERFVAVLIPIRNLGYLIKLWEEVKKERPSNQPTAKGDALEYLAAYLQLLIPGLVPRRKVSPKTKDMEHDLVVSNLRQSSSLEAELLGRDFLVECKNWKESVGASEVGYFLYRMRLTHTRFGIMFARSDISGGANDASIFASNLRQRAFHEDGSLCIVIKDPDIEKIIEKKTT